jgi:hypothetical protein
MLEAGNCPVVDRHLRRGRASAGVAGEGRAALALLVAGAEQGCPLRLPPALARHDGQGVWVRVCGVPLCFQESTSPVSVSPVRNGPDPGSSLASTL